MRRLPTLLALATALVVFAGCRDILVDLPSTPAPGPVAPPGPGIPGVETGYLKGPELLYVGTQGNYRAEMVTDAVRFEWLVVGDGGLEVILGAEPRTPVGHARARGTVDLISRAYDADGRLVGISSKEITIR